MTWTVDFSDWDLVTTASSIVKLYFGVRAFDHLLSTAGIMHAEDIISCLKVGCDVITCDCWGFCTLIYLYIAFANLKGSGHRCMCGVLWMFQMFDSIQTWWETARKTSMITAGNSLNKLRINKQKLKGKSCSVCASSLRWRWFFIAECWSLLEKFCLNCQLPVHSSIFCYIACGIKL